MCPSLHPAASFSPPAAQNSFGSCQVMLVPIAADCLHHGHALVLREHARSPQEAPLPLPEHTPPAMTGALANNIVTSDLPQRVVPFSLKVEHIALSDSHPEIA